MVVRTYTIYAHILYLHLKEILKNISSHTYTIKATKKNYLIFTIFQKPFKNYIFLRETRNGSRLVWARKVFAGNRQVDLCPFLNLILNILKSTKQKRNRYNPDNIPLLEEYVQYQIEEKKYNLDANLALLKLYQFNPNHFQTLVTAHILLKALTNLPHSDFLLCKCLIENSRVSIFLFFWKIFRNLRFFF